MKKAILFFLALFVVSCATVQYSERKTLMLVSPQQEMELGEEAFKQVLENATLSTYGEWNAIIQRVGNTIAQVAEKPEYKWEFVLIEDDKTVNAFALPGGKVAFYTGILPLCENEDGVAVVMGHEIAHAIARHGAERMSQGLMVNMVGNMLESAISDPKVQEAVLQGYGLTTSLGVMLPFSRKHEFEADYIGLILMAKAKYRPEAAPDFWKRMLALSKGNTLEFLSTHPNDEKRIAELENHMPEAKAYYLGRK